MSELPDIEAEGERIVRDTYRPSKDGGYLWTDVVGAVQTAIAEERARHIATTSPAPASAANSEAVAWPMHIINLFEQAAKVAAIADRFGRLPDNEPINIVRAGTGREGHMDLITLRRLAALVKAFPPMQALQPHPSQQAGTEASIPVSAIVAFDVEDYVDGYELRADEGAYTPTEHERGLITDAIHGVLSEISMIPADEARK